jgi:hypothetical protein
MPGTTWREYYAWLHHDRDEARDTEVDPAEFEPIVTQTAGPLDNPISALERYAKLGVQHGWDITLGHSKALQRQAPFKSGENEGKARPDRNIEQQWCYMVKDGEVVEVSYMIVNDKVSSADTLRRLNRVPMSDASLKSVIKGEL